MYFYKKFMNKFNVVFVLILDFFYFKKFLKFLKKINLPLSSLIPVNNDNSYIDYPIFVNYSYNLEKIVFLSLLNQISFLSYNYKYYKNKLNFLKIFYNFSNINNFFYKL